MVSREPDRPDHGRVRAERCLRRRGCAPARARRGTRSSASTTTTTPAHRWTSSALRSRRRGAGRSRPRTAITARTSRELARPRRPGSADARADRGVARALPHPLRLLGEAERDRGARAGAAAAARHVRAGRARSGRARRRTATTRTACSSARTTDDTYRAADVAYVVDKLERGFDRAIYVLGADHHGTSHWYAAAAGCSATTRSASRCSSTSSCI